MTPSLHKCTLVPAGLQTRGALPLPLHLRRPTKLALHSLARCENLRGMHVDRIYPGLIVPLYSDREIRPFPADGQRNGVVTGVAMRTSVASRIGC